MGICRPLLNQKLNMEWFLLQRFADLVRIYFLLSVNRNHSNKVNIVLISGFRQIYAGCCQLHVYFNDMQINRWRKFKDKGQLFTLNLPMTTTKIRRISLLRTFYFFGLIRFAPSHMLFNVEISWNFETFSNSCGFAFI